MPTGVQGGVEEPVRGRLEADRGRPRVGRLRRAALAAGLRRGDDHRVEHGVLDVRRAVGRRRRGHRVVRHRGAEEALLPAHALRAVGGHDVPDGAAGGERRRQRQDVGDEQRRRQLHHSRHEDLHLRRRPRPRGEHHSPRAGARRRRARGNEGAHALHRPQERDGRRRQAHRRQRREPGEHRAQDGDQRVGDVRPQLRRRRHLPRLARGRRVEAEPGHAADVQADEQRAHRRRHPGPGRRVDRVPQRGGVREGAQAGREHGPLGRTLRLRACPSSSTRTCAACCST